MADPRFVKILSIGLGFTFIISLMGFFLITGSQEEPDEDGMFIDDEDFFEDEDRLPMRRAYLFYDTRDGTINGLIGSSDPADPPPRITEDNRAFLDITDDPNLERLFDDFSGTSDRHPYPWYVDLETLESCMASG